MSNSLIFWKSKWKQYNLFKNNDGGSICRRADKACLAADFYFKVSGLNLDSFFNDWITIIEDL